MNKFTLALLSSAALFTVSAAPAVLAQPSDEQKVESDPSKSLGDSDRQQAEGAEGTAVQQGETPADGAGSVQQPNASSPDQAGAGDPAENLGDQDRATSGGGTPAP